MANTFAPNGLVPYAPSGGSTPPTFAMRPVQISYNYGTKIFKGDPVQMAATGLVTQWSAGTATSQDVGIFWGCEYLSISFGYMVDKPFWNGGTDTVASTIVRAFVIPCDLANFMWFLAQSDATGLTQGNVGMNIDLNMGTGSTTTGLSGAYLDTTTISTLNTKPFKIMRLYSEGSGTNAPAFGGGGIDNGSSAGAFNKAYVAANIATSTGI